MQEYSKYEVFPYISNRITNDVAYDRNRDFVMHKTNRALSIFSFTISKVEKIPTTSNSIKRMQRQSAKKPTSRTEMWKRRKFVTEQLIVSHLLIFADGCKCKIKLIVGIWHELWLAKMKYCTLTSYKSRHCKQRHALPSAIWFRDMNYFLYVQFAFCIVIYGWTIFFCHEHEFRFIN